jgi:hypothetical protein
MSETILNTRNSFSTTGSEFLFRCLKSDSRYKVVKKASVYSVCELVSDSTNQEAYHTSVTPSYETFLFYSAAYFGHQSHEFLI